MQMTATEYENSLSHYGILHKSGRYPWGSGKNPLQRSMTFLDIYKAHKKEGLSDSQIAKMYNINDEHGKPTFTVNDLRAVRTRAVAIDKEDKIRTVHRLRESGMSDSAIGRQMGINESTVRSLGEPGRLDKINRLQKTADMLRRQVDEKGMIDIGSQVERALPIGDNPETHIGISRDLFKTSVSMLKEEGYNVHKLRTDQIGTGEKTTRLVLTKPGISQKHAFLNQGDIGLITEKTEDRGRNYQDEVFKRPLSIDPKRVAVKYKEGPSHK